MIIDWEGAEPLDVRERVMRRGVERDERRVRRHHVLRLGHNFVRHQPLEHAAPLVRAELPLHAPGESAPVFPPKLAADLSTLSSEVSWEPVWVLVSAEGTGGEEMLSLLGDEYGAVGEREGDWWKLTIRPIDQFRRGTIIYRVIQASPTLADRHPELTIYLVTEDGKHWRLPPPSLQPD